MKGETGENQTVVDRWEVWRKSNTYTTYDEEVK